MPKQEPESFLYLSEQQPRLWETFKLLEKHLNERFQNDISEIHLDGFEELLTFLDETILSFEAHTTLGKLVVLVKRLRADFETAFCVFMIGLDQATFDTMRDVLEIEFLIREFVFDKELIGAWLNAPSENRWKLFGPGKLRDRHAKRHSIPVNQLVNTREYRAHSEMIHITPEETGIIKRGVSRSEHPQFGATFALADIFHHAWDAVIAIHALAAQAIPPPQELRDPKAGLAKFKAAFQITMERYQEAEMWVGYYLASAEKQKDDNG